MYIGRFAPSPSGPLHFGSLVAALASYLDAQAHHGQWLVRIEDLDQPRCQPGAADAILNTLVQHGMTPDRPVLFQSHRLKHYAATVNNMLAEHTAYFCQCTRKIIKANGGVYQGHCRNLAHDSGAVRFLNTAPIKHFQDRWQGNVDIDDPHAIEDFIVWRKDKIFAYNLAVVMDDIASEVTHIVRGEDLLTTTSAHLVLYRYFEQAAPKYMHIPVIKDANGQKLSKQNHAPAIDNRRAVDNLIAACNALQLPDLSRYASTNVEKIISFATQAWHQRWPSSKLAPLV